MLIIKGLKAKIEGKEILKGLDLEVKKGEVHAIMGPNGSGKSTLASVLAGREGYEVTEGEVIYDGKNLLEIEAEERAREGIFLAFQYPIEIPGVSTTNFMKTSINEIRKHNGLEPMKAQEFMKRLREKAALVELDVEMTKRYVNVGFSGGEKKRNDMLQMALLQPRLAILDETDSGLDVDALKAVAQAVNAMRSPERALVLITHYERLLEVIVPDRVHVLWQGRIVASGGAELARRIEREGYAWLQHGVALPNPQEV